MIGELDAGNPHVQFDEGAQETCDSVTRLCPTLPESPEKTLSFPINPFRPFRSFSVSVLSSDACLRLRLLHEPIPLSGYRNHYSASRASPTSALTRALTKEPAVAGLVARDKPLAW
jgi:hypothetical protein